MKVLLAPAAKDGCGLYRMELPGKVLQKQGFDIDIRMDYNFRSVYTRNADGSESLIGVRGTVPWDLVVIQRPLRRRMFELMCALQDKGIAVVVELDDSFHDLAITHPSFKETDPDEDPEKNRDWLMRCTLQADWVTVTTPYLAERYAPHGRVSVLPNYVPRHYLDFQREPSEDIRIGWAGATHTHVGDLRRVGGVMQSVLDATGANFCVVGQGQRVQMQLGLNDPPMVSGWLPLERYPQVLAQLDIGIAPHKQTNFGKAKSGLKPIEMSAVGVVPVMSPIPDYLRVHEYGIGLIAETPDEWRNHLLRLAQDHDYRRALSNEGREIVREHFLIEQNAYRWIPAWEQAMSVRESVRYALNSC